MDLLERCKRDFAREYGKAPGQWCARRPVNLIGEHTDYHEGFVLPVAIRPAITLAGRRRSDRLLRVYSRTLGASFACLSDDVARPPDGGHTTSRASFGSLPAAYPMPGGADVLVEADLSYGGGLSPPRRLSSASARCWRDSTDSRSTRGRWRSLAATPSTGTARPAGSWTTS